MNRKSDFRFAFFIPRVVIGSVLYAAGLVLAFAPMSRAVADDNAAAELSQSVPAQAPGRWMATDDLATGRYRHTATLLSNGQVLVAGGLSNSTYLASAELYDPATELWTATGSMATARANHTATLLLNGQVLVAGGYDFPNLLASAELYDPATGVWAATGSMATARSLHTATLLPNGKVLVVGNYGFPGPPLASAELYDPVTGGWTATSAPIARCYHTATLLPNGQVLVAGGIGRGNSASAELYNPATGGWTATGSMITGRALHTATLLANGQVLAAGGFNLANGHTIVSIASAELYDPATGVWTATGSMASARYSHTATLLPNGQVLAAGGVHRPNSNHLVKSTELYDPATGNWTATASLSPGRTNHTAILLLNGNVLGSGGTSTYGVLAQAELYESAPQAADIQ